MHAVLLLSLVSLARAWPLDTRHILDRRESVPSGFVKVSAAPSDSTFELRIQLTNSDIAGLEDRLKTVSSPSSPEYGKWLTRDEVNVFVAPTQESLSAVSAFLATQGLEATSVSPAGDIVAVNVTVAQANTLFDTEYYTFQSTDTGDTTVRTLEYSVPASLKEHLSYIHPTTMYALTNSPIQARTTDPSYDHCKEYITPACIEHMYGLPTDPATATANANDSITVTAYGLQFVQRDDLKMFLEEFRPDVDADTDYTVKGIGGSFDPQGPAYAGVEADLDVEYAIGLATDIPLNFVSVGYAVYDDGAGGFYATAEILAAHSDTSHVVTTSYGGNEDELSVEVAQALCNVYLQLSAMGITVIFSSGDGGVSGGQSQTCTTFVPTFPSGCPYVLSVGATQYNGTEVAAGFSSGGFSNIFPRPWYQDKEVSSYLKDLGDTYEGLYNASGRGFPDVAAIGHYAAIAYAGEWALVDGTSVSAPVFAATVALLNDKLLAAGKPTLGFIQPLLYENPHALTDIKHGSNAGCDTDGFSAGSGWDPVTGLGVPDFDSMMKVIGFHK
ncbi:family S53 protease [Peniophora sp. CONT]|nr:family S53 protease [Peniophora sp. CONT]